MAILIISGLGYKSKAQMTSFQKAMFLSYMHLVTPLSVKSHLFLLGIYQQH